VGFKRAYPPAIPDAALPTIDLDRASDTFLGCDSQQICGHVIEPVCSLPSLATISAPAWP
jgi:hypothetical protein